MREGGREGERAQGSRGYCSPESGVLVGEVVHEAGAEHVSFCVEPLEGHRVTTPRALPRLGGWKGH